MKKGLTKLAIISSLTFSSLLISSCNKGGEVTDNTKEIIASISSLSLKVNEEKTFSLTLKNIKESEELSFVYNEEIISLSKEENATNTYKVKGLKEGSTNIEISLKNDKSVSKSTIFVEIEKEDDVNPTGISADFHRSVIGVNEEIIINVSVLPSTIANANLTYESSDTSVAKFINGNTLKGVAVGKADISIYLTDYPDIDGLTFTIEVSANENKVKNDEALSMLKLAIGNEKDEITHGEVSITFKNQNIDNIYTFSNTYDSYLNVTYNQINDFSNNEYLEYHGYDSSSYYEVKKVNDLVSSAKVYEILEDGSYISFADSQKHFTDVDELSNYGMLYVNNYDESYTRGIGAYLEEKILTDTVLDDSSTSITYENNTLTLVYNVENYVTKVKNYLSIEFDNENFKEISFKNEIFNSSDLDENFEVVDSSVTAKEYTYFEASLENGTKVADDSNKFNPQDLYFDDFELEFFGSNDNFATARTEFYRGETIIYELKSKSPNDAVESVDHIKVSSSSNEEVVSIGSNKMSLQALSEGSCEVVFASRDVTKTYTFNINVLEATSIEITLEATSMKCTSTETFQVNVSPYGAKDDIVVSLSEGSEKYATLSKTDYGYYKLVGNKDMEESEGEVTINAVSASNPELKASKTITVVKGLTSKELFDILTTHKYVSEGNSDYYGDHLEASFTDTLNDDGTYIGTVYWYNKSNSLIDEGIFYYTISSGKMTVVKGPYFSEMDSIIESFKMSVETADGLTIKATFIANDYYFDSEEFTFTLQGVAIE